MRRLTLVVATLALAVGVAGCGDGGCETVTTDRDTVRGTAVYTPGSTAEPFALADAKVWSMGRSALDLDVIVRSAHEGSRSVRVRLSGLSTKGPQTLGGPVEGRACLVLQSDAPSTCLPLAGTVDVRRLDADCFHHESGVSVCAENVDVSLHATVDDHGVAMRLDLDVDRAQRWRDAACDDRDGLL